MFIFLLFSALALFTSGDSDFLSRSKKFKLDPMVPLSHCTTFGPNNDFRFEWQLSLAPKWTLEARYTTSIEKGYSGIGFSQGPHRQIITGHPVENVHCSRSLFDTYSPYDVAGNVYPNFPEVPSKETWHNTSHVAFYIMRNLTVSARSFLEKGAQGALLNVTVLWSFMQQSLFESGCYMQNLNNLTEYAVFELSLKDEKYRLGNDGVCKPFEDNPKNGGATLLNPEGNLLDNEDNMNNRATILFIGGDLLSKSGNEAPTFSGSIVAGTNDICSHTKRRIVARWDGFSDTIGGIVRYEVSVGSPEKPSLYYDRYDAKLTRYIDLPSFMEPGTEYRVRVSAYNFAGLQNTQDSKPIFILDDGRPINGSVRVTGPKLYQHHFLGGPQNEVNISFKDWLDQEHKSKNGGTWTEEGYSIAVGLVGKPPDSHKGWTTVEKKWPTELRIRNLNLESKKSYYVSIRSKNCAGYITMLSSSGFTVDYDPPTVGYYYIGNTTTTPTYMTIHTPIRLFFGNFSDTGSGLKDHFYWGVGTTNNKDDVIKYSKIVKGTDSLNELSFFDGSNNKNKNQKMNWKDLIGKSLYFNLKVEDNVDNYAIKSHTIKIVSL